MPLTPVCTIERKTVLRILGLQLDLLDGIEEMLPEHYNHRTLCEWIERSLEQNSEHIDSIDENAATAQQLASIGFDPSSDAVKNIIERSSAASTQQHVRACELARIFIADEFKYNPLLSPPSERFPFKSNKTNEYFFLVENRTEDYKTFSLHQPCQNYELGDKGVAIEKHRGEFAERQRRRPRFFFSRHRSPKRKGYFFSEGDIFKCWTTEARL